VNSIIYHLVPQDYWEAVALDRPYTPADYEHAGFIHCTAGVEQLAIVANRYYRRDARVWLALTIAAERVSAVIRYEPGEDDVKYPHIYGALNRDAVINVQVMPRQSDGTFQPLAHS
jgi:uncharacterized protein (DUF952 family)